MIAFTYPYEENSWPDVGQDPKDIMRDFIRKENYSVKATKEIGEFHMKHIISIFIIFMTAVTFHFPGERMELEASGTDTTLLTEIVELIKKDNIDKLLSTAFEEERNEMVSKVQELEGEWKVKELAVKNRIFSGTDLPERDVLKMTIKIDKDLNVYFNNENSYITSFDIQSCYEVADIYFTYYSSVENISYNFLHLYYKTEGRESARFGLLMPYDNSKRLYLMASSWYAEKGIYLLEKIE